MEFAVGILGAVVTLLAASVTYLAWKNGKTTRENTEKILNFTRENTEKTLNSTRESTEKLLNAMDGNTTKILTAIKETSKIIALLILAETSDEKKSLAQKLLEM